MWRQLRKMLQRQNGYAMILALIALLVISVMGAAILAAGKTNLKVGGLAADAPQALLAAEAGIQYGHAVIMEQHGNFLDWTINHANHYAGSIGNGTYSVDVTLLKTNPFVLDIVSTGTVNGLVRKVREQVNYGNAPFLPYAAYSADPTHAMFYYFDGTTLNGYVYAAGNLTMDVGGLNGNAVCGGKFTDTNNTIPQSHEIHVSQIWGMPDFDAKMFRDGRRLADGKIPNICIGGVDANLGTMKGKIGDPDNPIPPGSQLQNDDYDPNKANAATLTMNRLSNGTIQYVLTGQNGSQTFSQAEMQNALLYVQGDLRVVDGKDYKNTSWGNPTNLPFSLGKSGDNTTNANQQATFFCTGSMYLESSGDLCGRVGLMAQTNVYFLNSNLDIGVNRNTDKSSAAFIYAGNSIGGKVGSLNGTLVYNWERNSESNSISDPYRSAITVYGTLGRDSYAANIIQSHPDQFTMANPNDLTWGSGPQFVNWQEL